MKTDRQAKLRGHMAAAYSRAAARYQSHVLPIFLPMAHALVAALPVTSSARVLDLASGGGAVLDALRASSAGRTVAGDFAAGALTAARARHPGVDYVLLDLETELPFVEGSFDIVTCSFGLNHLSDAGAALGRIRRLLKDGGRLGITAWQKSSASPLSDLYDDAIEDLLGRNELDWEPEFDEMIEDAVAALRTKKGIETLLSEAGYEWWKISRYLLEFVFKSPQDYVNYRLAWGTDAELVGPLGPDAARIIADRLTALFSDTTPLSWTRHYFVAVAS